jgi:hypothetical protein
MTGTALIYLHAGNDETAVVLKMKLHDLSEVFSFIQILLLNCRLY